MTDVNPEKLETLLVHGYSRSEERTGAVSFPIYQSATFRHPGLGESTGYDYSRLQNPTREELERTMALLEKGKKGFAFSTGMAAVAAALSLFSRGEHIIVSEDLYGGSFRLIEDLREREGIEFTYVDSSDTGALKTAIRQETRAFFIETPTNPLMKVADLKAIAALADEKGILLLVDNTFLTPYCQRPLELGAHVVIHSGTKYLGGHNDTLAGLLVVSREDLAERIGFTQKTTGAVLSPFDSWLILRGLKTLAVRMDRQQENAMRIARWLEGDERIRKVYYPGLPGHKGHETSRTQASGFGAMISFEVDNRETVEKVLKGVKTIMFAESLGGVETLITYPAVQTHASIPEERRNSLGVNERLLRLSVGLESPDDLIADLDRALK